MDRGALVNVAWGGGAVNRGRPATANNGGKAADNEQGRQPNNGGNGSQHANNSDRRLPTAATRPPATALRPPTTTAATPTAVMGRQQQLDRHQQGRRYRRLGRTGRQPLQLKAGAGEKNSGIAKWRRPTLGRWEPEPLRRGSSCRCSRLPLTGASMTGIVLAVAHIALGGGFLLVRRHGRLIAAGLRVRSAARTNCEGSDSPDHHTVSRSPSPSVSYFPVGRQDAPTRETS